MYFIYVERKRNRNRVKRLFNAKLNYFFFKTLRFEYLKIK